MITITLIHPWEKDKELTVSIESGSFEAKYYDDNVFNL